MLTICIPEKLFEWQVRTKQSRNPFLPRVSQSFKIRVATTASKLAIHVVCCNIVVNDSVDEVWVLDFHVRAFRVIVAPHQNIVEEHGVFMLNFYIVLFFNPRDASFIVVVLRVGNPICDGSFHN